MTKDINKLISSIEYNYLNLPSCVTFATGHVVEYVYDATGFRRSVIYKTQQEPVFSMLEAENFATAQPLVIETVKHYSGNRIYNAQTYPTNIFTENGYIESDIYHFYIKDYQGNNRVVINQDGVQVQANHYYPYGATMGEGLANSTQPYKYSGKELDTMNGLNQYDFGARQQDPALGIFTSVDPMAEKYSSISPYAYCAGNPILYVDPTGMDWISATYNNEHFYFYDDRIKGQDDVTKYYGKDTEIRYWGQNGSVKVNDSNGNTKNIYSLNGDGSFSKDGIAQKSEYNQDGFLHIGNDKFTNSKTILNNWYGNYLGPDNPEFNKNSTTENYSYAIPPINHLDYSAYLHDKGYDAVNAINYTGVFSLDTSSADIRLGYQAINDNNYNVFSKRFWWSKSSGLLFLNLGIQKNNIKKLKSIFK